MAKILTIDELYSILRTERTKGNGKKKIMISTDDEGNGYHPLFFGVSFEDAKNDCVILG